MELGSETAPDVVARLRHLQRRIDDVIGMLDDDHGCEDVVGQLALVSRALRQCGFTVVAAAFEQCGAGQDVESCARAERDALGRLFLTLA